MCDAGERGRGALPPERPGGRLRRLDEPGALPRDQGNGTATVSADADEMVLRALVERYPGGTDSPLAEWLFGDDREEVRVRIDPEQGYSWDYAERMGNVGER